MHATVPFHPATRSRASRAAGLIALLMTLAACNANPPQSQLAEPLEAAYQQLVDPSVTALGPSCDTAPILAQSLDGWIKAVQGAGLQSRFSREIAEAERRATAIRHRCPDTAAVAAAPKPRTRPARDHTRNDVRPPITADMLDAYVRGVNEEIVLMRATGSHFVSLSKYDEQGRQVAAKAGLSLPEYSKLKRAVHKVLYEQMMHERYAGSAGQARMAGLEPHKRQHAQDVLARDPYASLSTAERELVQARRGSLREQYDGYMHLAAIAD